MPMKGASYDMLIRPEFRGEREGRRRGWFAGVRFTWPWPDPPPDRTPMTTLTWRLNGRDALPHSERRVIGVLRKVTDAWATACGGELGLVEHSGPGPADIYFEFGKTEGARLLEHRTIPTRDRRGQRHVLIFDSTRPWNCGALLVRVFGSGHDLRNCALHGVGLCLGLSPNDRESSVMHIWPAISGLKKHPDAEDAAEAMVRLLSREPQSWRD